MGKILGKRPFVRRREDYETEKVLREMGNYKDGRRMEVAQGCVQWWALVLAMLNRSIGRYVH
jgi:hypothetical protein